MDGKPINRGQRLIWRETSGIQAIAQLDTPVGGLQLTAKGEVLVSVDFRIGGATATNASETLLPPILAQAVASLHDYFHKADTLLAIPLQLSGTEYQRRVWQRLVDIPMGQVASYGQLAKELDSGPRAVAAACRANPYPLIIPCHRVVAATGLGGYCGASDGAFLEIKRWLLAHERRGAYG